MSRQNYQIHLCIFVDAADQTVMVKSKAVRFEFSERFGPALLDSRGDPKARLPGERHPFWPAFEAWLAEWRKTHPKEQPRLAAQFNRDPQP